MTMAGGDNYEGQETIVFNDFRGGLPFSDLLQLCDKYFIMLNEEIGTLTLFLLKHNNNYSITS